MLTDADLETLWDHESDRVERKRNANDPARIRQAICAFANDLPNHGLPGVIFIGQEDDGSCSNLDVDAQLLEKLGGWRGDGQIQPLPNMTVASRTVRRCTVAVVEVQPSDNPPVRYEGRAWIRVGPRRAIATAEEERQLIEKRRWGNLPFDAQGVPGTTLEDLDLRRFQTELLPALVPPDVLVENKRAPDQQLRALRLAHREGMLTVTGILFLGTTPLTWIPGAYVQFLRVDGVELTDRISDRHELSGTLPDQMRRLDDLIAANVRHASIVGGPRRIDQPDYPEDGLRQLIRNALIHRTYEGTNAPVRLTWYSDRIEIQSPGGPFGQVTIGNFGQHGVTDYRNPTIAELTLRLGFMERFGVGIEKARKALADNGNPPLDFAVNMQHVLAIVRVRK